ncbi:hypothetical protein EUTSA_v10016024mg [Eutrema salsugineum]|uniref:Uncharacterized protein n=1 Tax=Eutrema salsugineum TaxID=72664 RepID=V4KYN0_EUTSA|nr:hypothetical protein EUTSA_v10016024mg [Eutrema salsugineum]
MVVRQEGITCLASYRQRYTFFFQIPQNNIQMYCNVCDKPAPCAQWMSSHCNASAESMQRKVTMTLESESFYYDSDYDHL